MAERLIPPAPCARLLVLSGQVQGVGMRPYIRRLADRCAVRGWVQNHTGTVVIHVEGETEAVQQFEQQLLTRPPPQARPRLTLARATGSGNFSAFEIRASTAGTPPDIHLPVDLPLCPRCAAEMNDPGDRRYHYAFINCTDCGPRYSIIRRLPYDRARTALADFPLCTACRAEYDQPADRRHHAEAIVCPRCGPRLSWRRGRQSLNEPAAALAACLQALADGAIVAVKGVGGYHLLCDASDDAAVRRLRARKQRPHKPLAVMLPPTAPQRWVQCDARSEQWLRDNAHPVLLLPKRRPDPLAPSLAPGLNEIGVMLPYSPLHWLLLQQYAKPLVATSANLSGEPVLIDDAELEQRLAPVFDAVLRHDRAILRPADDPVYRVIAGIPRPLRLGRGNAPLELTLPFALPQPVLATGGHMKNTIALAWDRRIVISPHLGDLTAARSQAMFARSIADLQALYQVRAQRVICDAHPGYASSRWARASGLPMHTVYHHHAHASALAGEYPQEQRWLVFTWDGSGLGCDGSLWGGEALLGRAGHWQRVASLRPFRLPGGDRVGREPWRSAAALCWETATAWQAPVRHAQLARQAWQENLNCHASSAAGRLFDAAAALLLHCHHTSYEGQAAMELEALAAGVDVSDAAGVELPLRRDTQGVWRSDWQALLPLLLDGSLSVAQRARAFHASLSRCLLRQAGELRASAGDCAVGLCGGVFQNRLLTQSAVATLSAAGWRVYVPRQLPTNDAAVSFGQVLHLGQAEEEFTAGAVLPDDGICY